MEAIVSSWRVPNDFRGMQEKIAEMGGTLFAHGEDSSYTVRFNKRRTSVKRIHDAIHGFGFRARGICSECGQELRT